MAYGELEIGYERMKRKKWIALPIIAGMIIGGAVYFKMRTEMAEDAVRFASEYTEVDEDNVFVYADIEQTMELMKNGTGIVYLGYPECGWCQAYVRYLNEAAREAGVTEVYYCNTKEVKESSMDQYYALIDLLDGHLQYTETGEQWIYVPNVSFHIEGELIGNDYETSKDTHDLTEPAEYWTEDEVRELKQTLTGYMEQVVDALVQDER